MLCKIQQESPKFRSGGSLQRDLAAASQGSGHTAQQLKLSKWHLEVKTEFRQVARNCPCWNLATSGVIPLGLSPATEKELLELWLVERSLPAASPQAERRSAVTEVLAGPAWLWVWGEEELRVARSPVISAALFLSLWV